MNPTAYNVQWNHRVPSTDSIAVQAVASNQQYYQLGGQPRMTVNGLHHASAAGTIEIVTIKTPHRQKQVPETSI